MSEAMLTTTQVAERLGVSTKRVWALIKAGRLPSQQFGRDHLIREEDLALVADRKPGRQKKAVAETPIVAAEVKAEDVVTAKLAKKRNGKKETKRQK